MITFFQNFHNEKINFNHNLSFRFLIIVFARRILYRLQKRRHLRQVSLCKRQRLYSFANINRRIVGGYVGYKLNGFSIETGFYGYYPSVPFIDYDYDKGIPGNSNVMSSGDGYYIIPLRMGKEFLFAKEKIFVKPEVSLNSIYSIDYPYDQPSTGWGEGTITPFNINQNVSGDSTVAYGYYTSLWNFALETSLSAGNRFKKRADIYAKFSYSAYFRPPYYETITHYSKSGETVSATRVNVNATLFQIGLKFYFKKQ